ncbi:hypothetical protein AVT10_12010 [Sphingomonas hankookensis]|uniref:Right handed beta helix domain-containing protein n=1 Tax=Sphingomonas hankookensis TaxID=563996 RepID=A0ABR5YDF8_9SPHN|nr:hypothetical protein AVT10_12010 [Sphingomonas hankookensis]
MNGAARLRVDAPDVTIGPVVVQDAYRAVETDAGVDTPRIRIRGLKATGLTRDGIRLRAAPGALIEDFDLTHADAPSTGEHLPQGIAITAGTGITIRNGRVARFRMPVEPGKYTNGDGIATEGGTSGTIANTLAEDNSDGGFDIKGTWTLDRTIARRNGRDYRFWNTVTAGTITAEGWTSAAVWIGKGARVRIDHLIASNDNAAPLLIVAGSTDVVITRCTLSRPTGAPLVKSEGSGNRVVLGAGCK